MGQQVEKGHRALSKGREREKEKGSPLSRKRRDNAAQRGGGRRKKGGVYYGTGARGKKGRKKD